MSPFGQIRQKGHFGNLTFNVLNVIISELIGEINSQISPSDRELEEEEEAIEGLEKSSISRRTVRQSFDLIAYSGSLHL